MFIILIFISILFHLYKISLFIFFHQVPFQWPLGSADKSRNKKRKTDKIIVADNVQAMHVQDS
jgi:hypothetical protein